MGSNMRPRNHEHVRYYLSSLVFDLHTSKACSYMIRRPRDSTGIISLTSLARLLEKFADNRQVEELQIAACYKAYEMDRTGGLFSCTSVLDPFLRSILNNELVDDR